MLKFSNRGISTPLVIGIIAVLVIVIGGIILIYQYSTPKLPQFSNSCSSNIDCEVEMGCGGCSWLCVNKNNYVPEKCDPDGPICEMAPLPSDQICGCANSQCQFSSEIFKQYKEIKNKALDLVISDYKEAMSYCSQLHADYLLDCYSRIAERILLINVSKADEICGSITDKYFVGNSVENDCYFSLARGIVNENPDLAITFCSKSSEDGKPNEASINNKSYCVRDIAFAIAKNDFTKAFEFCDTEGNPEDPDFCKSFTISRVYEDIADPDLAFKKIVEPDICEKANFSTDYKEWYELYYGECKNFYVMINASILAKNKKIEEAISMCDTITKEHIDDTVGDCYKKVAVAVSKYDIDKAKSICEKISGDSTKIECNQDILK